MTPALPAGLFAATAPSAGGDDRHGLFVYGSLLEPAFLHGLLEREVPMLDAELEDYERCELPGLLWPVVRAASGGRVAGRYLLDLGSEDYRRLDAYEGVDEGLYVRISVAVLVANERRPANLYLPSSRTLDRYQWSRR